MKKLDWPLMDNNITKEDLSVLIDFLGREPILTQSGEVRNFEAQWGSWLGSSLNTMVNSGSSANEITMLALKELYGDGEVIVPPLTWVSDIASILHAGLKPVFADISPNTLGLDFEQVQNKITRNTKAIFLTHILGYNALSDRLLELVEKNNIALIEDCCESHGTTHNGQKVGTFGLASNFSFYYAHHLSTIEGGMISTNCNEFHEVCRMARSHGMVRECPAGDTKVAIEAAHPDLNPAFIFKIAAHNMRSSEINAVIGQNQLKRLDSNNLLRTKNLKLFLANLNPSRFFTEFITEGSSNYALTLVLREKDTHLRTKVEELLNSLNVEYRRGTSGGGNQLRQPYLRKIFGDAFKKFLVTDHIHFFGYYIGNYPTLEEAKILQLCQLLNEL